LVQAEIRLSDNDERKTTASLLFMTSLGVAIEEVPKPEKLSGAT
jgi:hypothetical protein